MGKLPLLFTLAIALAACSRTGVELHVQNASPQRIESVSAHGRGFEAYIGDLEPGQDAYVTVYPYSEAGVGLSFNVHGRTYSSPESGYFESGAGYRVTAVVGNDLSVKVDSTGGP